MSGRVPFGCGQCMPCLISRRQQWATRQFLESLCYEANCFVTLTYDNEHYPVRGSLEPGVVQLWFKRFRKAILPHTVRFFLCGEYGSSTQRPHYHLSLFGVSGHEVLGDENLMQAMARTWGRGFVYCAEFNRATAAYVTGYVSKHMTKMDDKRLAGRYPEFARMSMRPGLGAPAMMTVARQISGSHILGEHVDETGDVPRSLKVGAKDIPLGRYLLNRLRREVGFTDEYIQQIKAASVFAKSEEMCTLLEAAIATASTAQAEVPTFRSAYRVTVEGKIAAVKARHKVFEARRTL